MATYRWRIPLVQAVQFSGKNRDEVKELIGDKSENEEFLLGTGEYEEPKPPKVEGEQPEGEAKPEAEAPVEVNPDGVPYDSKAKPKLGPVEKTEPLKVAEGDWVVKDVASGKVEVNPEGFPEKYEFISG
jgi:hypothetical protein